LGVINRKLRRWGSLWIRKKKGIGTIRRDNRAQLSVPTLRRIAIKQEEKQRIICGESQRILPISKTRDRRSKRFRELTIGWLNAREKSGAFRLGKQ